MTLAHWDMSKVYAAIDYERRKPVQEKTMTEALLELIRKLGW